MSAVDIGLNVAALRRLTSAQSRRRACRRDPLREDTILGIAENAGKTSSWRHVWRLRLALASREARTTQRQSDLEALHSSLRTGA
jgi:hypothetical protein